MRILSKRQLKELVLYSPQHVARLEQAGQFPKRVHLGLSRVITVTVITVTGAKTPK
jgi:prophage regulatory protein